MNYIIIIQARMGSKRFPGKSMHKFNDKPSLSCLIDSLLQTFDKELIWIATSSNPENEAIAKFCRDNHIKYFSGDEFNVASRFNHILKNVEVDYFVRISGDSPLFDYRILKEAISNIDNSFDLYSTAYQEKFPSGMNFEILKRDIFINAYSEFTEERHFEHVTSYFYENDEKYKIFSFQNKIQNPERYKFSFDTVEDFSRIKSIFEKMDKPHYCYTLEEKCQIYDMVI